MAFERKFAENNIEKLKREKLFTGYLRRDIVETFSEREDANRDVFPAVRKGRIDFYHRGGKLFSYDGKFSTHPKYASVLACSKANVTEVDLLDAPRMTSFTEYYKRIKENCAVFAGDEAESVSRLYNQFSCAKKDSEGDIVVLDIEVSFANKDEDEPGVNRKRSRQDRIDVLLFKKSEGKLRFVEAKLFWNPDIRAKVGATPPVVGQIGRYRTQLKDNEQDILIQYRNHVRVMNKLFESNLPEPESLDLEPRLYVFAFDNDQKSGCLKKYIKVLRTHEVKVYSRGDPKSVDVKTLWNNAK